MFTTKKKRSFGTRTTNEFLYLPIVHRGEFHWLSSVKLERSFNGYKSVIIGVEKA